MNRRTITNNQGSVTIGNDPAIINANIINNDPSNPFIVKFANMGGPDNIYVNISIKGDDTGIQAQPHKTFTFLQWFPEPIIRNVENYYLSIVSLAFSATEVPLHIVNNIQPGSTQSNPNLTDWEFCFRYNNNDYHQFVEYTPYNNLPVPAPPSANPPNYTQSHTNYYFIEHYNVLVNMFNATLYSIYIQMYSANSAAFSALGLTGTDAPYFYYEASTEKFGLIYNKLFVGNGIDLYFSDTFSVFFPGFFTFYYGTGLTNGKDHKFIFETKPYNEFDTNNNFNVQMYSGSTTNLNTINQIVVTSNTLRTAFEFVTSDDSTTSFGYSNVIFSLLPDLPTPKDQKSRIVYVTNGQYRLIDIVGQGNINQLDFNVYYTDNAQNIYPINVPNGMVANAKIIFMKKTLKNYVY